MPVTCIQYTTETKVFVLTGSTDSNCNSILFINTGTSAVTIDGVTIQQGQQFRVDGNYMEILVKTYYFTFAAGGVNSLTVVFKRYL
jgi:hypothetical protein